MASNAEGVRYMLSRSDSPFASLINANSVIREVPTADAIFIDLKKHDCDAAMAPADALKKVVAALTRDGIGVEIDGGILDGDKLANWKVLKEQALLAQQTQQAELLKKQREADAAQKAADEEKKALEAQRQQNDEAARQAKIQEMRKLVASKANAVVDGFSDRLTNYMSVVREEISEHRLPSEQTITEFQPWTGQQPWAEQYATWINQGWEFKPIKATIQDYGRAQWMKRTIEAISVRVEFPMMNRKVGDKETACVDFIWTNDEEFGFRRNPMTVSCNEYGPAFAAWSEQNQFTSQWTLLQ